MENQEKNKPMRKLTGDELQAGPSQTAKQLEEMAWFGRKQMHVDLLTPEEIKRVLAEKEETERRQRQEGIETVKAREKVDGDYWSDIEKSCMDGDASERFARCIIRMANQNLFVTTMGSPVEKQRRIVQMLRLHGIQIKDGKERIPLTAYMSNVDLFVSDPFCRKSDPVLTRHLMFPSDVKV